MIVFQASCAYVEAVRPTKMDEFTPSAIPEDDPMDGRSRLNQEDDNPFARSTRASGGIFAVQPTSRERRSPEVPAGEQALLDERARKKVRFCFDMAHRDVNGLKADALTRRLHGDAPGAAGIQAPKLAPHVVSLPFPPTMPRRRAQADHEIEHLTQLDAQQVSKGSAGLVAAHARTRPRTLLPEPAAPAAISLLDSPVAVRR